ncbi:Fic family protein [Gemmatimonadota bacterium]
MKKPMFAPTLSELMAKLDLQQVLPKILEVKATPNGHYYHWDRLYHITPPDDLSHNEWWLGIKLARKTMLKSIQFYDKTQEPFQYSLPDNVNRMLHEVTQDASGQIKLGEEVTNPITKKRYIVNSLIEEAITSSQLEGASTTKNVAKQMIRSGRAPVTKSEHMILNNYLAMQFISENMNTELTPKFIFQLHRIVTENTLDEPHTAGCFRTPDDDITVVDETGSVLHTPPDASELPIRLQRMCQFANEISTAEFTHPVIRAIILHFWLGYDHPFVDGNGRTARAIFYWSMLSQGYWLAEFISISSILRKAPSKYAKSFLFTETDENDLTYFIIYHLEVIQRAIQELKKYLSVKSQEVRAVEILLRQAYEFNHRQLALLGHALRHPGMQYSIRSHQTSHKVSYHTARQDLLDLVDRGLLTTRKAGRTSVFQAPHDLHDILKEKGDQAIHH